MRTWSVRRPAGASPPIGTSAASKRKPLRRRHRVHRDVAAARAERVEDELAVALELARRRLVAQHVRPDEPERAVVGHHAHRHEGADALAELVRVEAADRDHTPLAAELVPAAHVPLGRMVEHARRASQGSGSARGCRRSARRCRSRSSTARCRGARRSRGRRRACPGRLKRAEPSENGCAAKPKPPASRTARAIPHASSPRWRISLIDPERQVVVAPERRDLVARQQQHVAVPALLAAPPRLERVVVGEQHHVRPRPRRRAGDLGHRPGPVRIGRVEMDHTGEVVHSP